MLPTKDKKEYLESQKREILKAQFRSEVAARLAEKRLGKALEAKKYEEASEYEKQIEDVKKADEGNNDYLELIDELLSEM